jgi:hypothetical protein
MDAEWRGVGTFVKRAASNQGKGWKCFTEQIAFFQPMLGPIKYRCVKEHVRQARWPSWQRAECSF